MSPGSRRPAYASSARRPLRGHILMDERSERRLRRIRWRRVGVTLLLLLSVAGLIALYRSPALRVQHVQVTGANVTGAGQIRELAALEGKSMLRPGLAAAEQRIRYLPMVADVRISRRWPQTVRIAVTERTPWGYWQSGDKMYAIDAEGVVLEGVQPPEGAPVIKDVGPPARLVPGDHTDGDAVRLVRALTEQIPSRLGLNVTSIEYSIDTGVVLQADAGYRVVIGDSQNTDYKLAVWQAVEAELGREAMAGHVLDLRFGDRPAFQ